MPVLFEISTNLNERRPLSDRVMYHHDNSVDLKLDTDAPKERSTPDPLQHIARHLQNKWLEEAPKWGICRHSSESNRINLHDN